MFEPAYELTGKISKVCRVGRKVYNWCVCLRVDEWRQWIGVVLKRCIETSSRHVIIPSGKGVRRYFPFKLFIGELTLRPTVAVIAGTVAGLDPVVAGTVAATQHLLADTQAA